MTAARVLCTFAGGSGHADPLVPVAVALRDAGHEVAFHGRRSGASTVVERGFTLFPDPDEAPGDPRSIAPLEPIDRAREERDFRAGFAERLARSRSTKVTETRGHVGARRDRVRRSRLRGDARR